MSDGPAKGHGRRRAALAVFALVQAVAAVFFISDAISDLAGGYVDAHTVIELCVALGLAAGAAFGTREMISAHRAIVRQEQALAVASGALGEVIESQFAAWGLTAAEREVAYLALKGFENAEIARLRDSAPGTVRAQMTRVYAKAGVSSRAQFAAYFVEDLLRDGLPTSAAGGRQPVTPPALAEAPRRG